MDTALYGVWDLGGTWIEITEGDRGPEVRLPGTQPGFAFWAPPRIRPSSSCAGPDAFRSKAREWPGEVVDD